MSELVLHEAAASGNYHELESLLMMGRIDVNFKDAEFGDRTALHWAAARGSNMKSHSCYR
jgi:ankyrin repeat protein